MKILKLYYRIRQRQNSDPNDYFRQIREKYGELKFGPVTTNYLSLDPTEVARTREQQFLIAETSNGPALVIKQMIGELEVDGEDEAIEIAHRFSEHVYAEYCCKFFLDRLPE